MQMHECYGMIILECFIILIILDLIPVDLLEFLTNTGIPNTGDCGWTDTTVRVGQWTYQACAGDNEMKIMLKHAPGINPATQRSQVQHITSDLLRLSLLGVSLLRICNKLHQLASGFSVRSDKCSCPRWLKQFADDLFLMEGVQSIKYIIPEQFMVTILILKWINIGILYQ